MSSFRYALEGYIQNILNSGEYERWNNPSVELLYVTNKYPELKICLNDYFVNNGVIKSVKMLSVTGTVPIRNKESNYNIPIVVWIPPNYYPNNPFSIHTDLQAQLEVFLIPTKPPEWYDESDRLTILRFNSHGQVPLSNLVYEYAVRHFSSTHCMTIGGYIDMLVDALCENPPRAFVPPGPLRSLTSDQGMSSSVEILISDIKKHLMNNQYSNVDRATIDILEATEKFKFLKTFVDQYEYNNGISQQLLSLSGILCLTIGVGEGFVGIKDGCASELYEIPLLIWLPKDYPARAPEVFLNHKKEKQLKFERNPVDQYGRFGHRTAEGDFGTDHLFKWDSLVEFIDKLVDALQDEPLVSPMDKKYTYCESDESGSNGSDSKGTSFVKDCEHGQAGMGPEEEATFNDIERGALVSIQPYPSPLSCTLNMMAGDSETNITVDHSDELTSLCTIKNVSLNNFCLFCSDLVLEMENERVLVSNRLEGESKMLKTLCNIMMQGWKDHMPAEILPSMFPFCSSCADLVKELSDCHDLLMNKSHLGRENLLKTVQNRMDDIVAAIERIVVDEFVLRSEHDKSSQSKEMAEKRYIQLRDIILNNYRSKLRLKKQGGHSTESHSQFSSKNRVEMTEQPIVSMGELIVKTEEDDCNDVIQYDDDDCNDLFEEENVLLKVEAENDDGTDTTLQKREDVPIFDCEKQSCSSSATSRKVTVSKPRNAAVKVFPELNPGPLRETEGSLVIDGGSKILWTRCLKTNESLLECRFIACVHAIRLGESVEDMNESYETMRQHILTNHADQIGRQIDERALECLHSESVNCKLRFADALSRDKHAVVHRICRTCEKEFGKKAFERNPNILFYHKCLQKRNKKRIPDGVNDELVVSCSNKKKKNSK